MTPTFEVGEKVIIDGLQLCYGIVEKETKLYYIVNGTKFRKSNLYMPTNNIWDILVQLRKVTPELEEKILKDKLEAKTIKLFGDFQRYPNITSKDWQEINDLLIKLMKGKQ